MATWNGEEEEEEEGGQGDVRGRAFGEGGGRSSLRNWSSPFSAEIMQSCGSFQAAALWSRPDKKKEKAAHNNMAEHYFNV